VKGVSPVRTFVLVYRDDTMIDRTPVGRRTRLDEYQDANDGRFPFTVGEKVSVEWKHNASTGKTTATLIGTPK